MSIEFKAALDWNARGYNVVPQKAIDKKHPGVKWKELQSRSVTDDELRSWQPMFQNGVGFITGAISGIVVIETDGLAGETVLDEFELKYAPLPETLTIRSGSRRGFHRHYKHPGYAIKTTANENIKIDVRGDGGFCLLPPSLHKSGGRYEIVHDIEPAELPRGLLEFIETKARKVAATANGSRAKPEDQAVKQKAPNGQSFLDRKSEHVRIFDFAPNLASTKGELQRPPIETMHAILRYLNARNYFERRDKITTDENNRIIAVGWRECGMALKLAYGDTVGFDLWAITHVDERARTDAPEQWASFGAQQKPGNVTIGTIIKAANDSGFKREGSPTAQASKSTDGITDAQGDVGNGKIFADMFRNKLLHVYETNDWLLFDSQQGWVPAPPGEAGRAAKAVLAKLRQVAGERYKNVGSDDPNVRRLMAHVARTSDAPHQRAMIDMATSEPGMTKRLHEFDADPMLLGLTNGVLDLKKGALLSVSPEILLSKRCNVAYDPHAESPRFDQFMMQVQPDEDVRRFLQRLTGYCLTGLVSEQKFAFFWGHGANGKSVFIELFGWLLGDYARKIATEMLLHHQRSPQAASPDILSLKGMRFIYANETEEGRRLAEARVKDLTGGDTLTGRMLYGKADISFQPTHKLIIVGNHKPEITDTSPGMWRRVALTPFEQTIPEGNRDRDLLTKLKAEGSGILNWMLAGLREWTKSGLQIPDRISAVTAAYRDEQDILGDWIREGCMIGSGCSAKKHDLYADYADWAKRNGHQPLAQSRLTRRLNERGYKLAADKRTVHGLALKHVVTLQLSRNV